MANKGKKPLVRKPSGAQGQKPDAKFNLPPNYKHPSFYPAGKSEPLFTLGERGKRMRSAAVVVGIMGLFGYAAWPRTDVQRNSYASKEDCEQDYVTGQCTYEQSTGSSGGGHYSGGGYRYYGPWYRSDWRSNTVAGDPGPGRTFRAGTGTTSGFNSHGPTGFDFGSRGGFGSHGRVGARGG